MKRFLISIVAAVMSSLFLPAQAQEKKYYFFRDMDYGSEAIYHPLGVLMNGGFDVLQSYQSSTRAGDIQWNIAATSVWQSVRSPAGWISDYGWTKFMTQEVLPTSFNIAKAQWAPNYTLHLIGGGMEYRKLSEWYDYHGYPAPFVFGAVTTMGYHFLNELIENGPSLHPNIDAIADLCIFDPLGIVFFSFDPVAEYFSTKFGLNDWSPQPSFSFRPFAFRNFGHSFVMRYPIIESKQTSAFFYLGKSTLIGLSRVLRNKDAISFGVGATQTGVWEVDQSNGISTNSIRVGAACGVFFDHDNSLLASLLISEYYLERVRLNVYPGVLFSSPFSPGFFFTLGSGGTYSAGFTIQFFPIGMGMYAPH
jgi:hypothetical protein